ncbi:hypothetical protein GCM10010417_31990 [Streptomyces carpaticus]
MGPAMLAPEISTRRGADGDVDVGCVMGRAPFRRADPGKKIRTLGILYEAIEHLSVPRLRPHDIDT